MQCVVDLGLGLAGQAGNLQRVKAALEKGDRLHVATNAGHVAHPSIMPATNAKQSE